MSREDRYRRFAYVYDLFMSDTPYGVWAAYIDRAVKKHRPAPPSGRPPLAVDLACGTGGVTVRMAEKGYDMIGADRSPDMLAVARAKAEAKNLSVLWLAQDMRELDLYGTADAAFCVCDGLNYLTTEAELAAVFSRTARFLNPGGVFIFDMNTAYKFAEKLGGKIFARTLPEASYVWKNRWDPASCVNEYALTVTLHSRRRLQKNECFTEYHYQRAYPAETAAALLKRAGFTVAGVYDAYTDDPPAPDSERISFTAVKL